MRPLTLFEYKDYQQCAAQNYSFYGLIATAMSQADTDNLDALKAAFPDIWTSFVRRYHAPGGVVPEWDGMTLQEYVQQNATGERK